MTATIGVLCARVRVEEKQLLAALAEAGVPALHLPPAALPLPLAPSPSGPSPARAGDGRIARVIVDRSQDRAIAAAVLPVWRSLGVTVLGAGLAATHNRVAVASALAGAGLPRPATRLACSEEAALAALDELGYPATLLPLTPGTAATVLCDRDSAEAVLEHRAVLGGGHDALALIQAGVAGGHERATVLVVGGKAVAVDGGAKSRASDMVALAEAAARALEADVVGIELALTASGPVIWDVNPVPDFRSAELLGKTTVAAAIAEMAACRLNLAAERPRTMTVQIALPSELSPGAATREVAGGVALSA